MKNILFILCTATFLYSCKKDSENTLTKMELLANSKWRPYSRTYTTTITVLSSNSTTTTVEKSEYDTFKDCEKDDFLKFNTDKTMVDDKGATLCTVGDTQRQYLTWDFNNDQTKLLITPPRSSYVNSRDILELSNTILRIHSVDSINNSRVKTVVEFDGTYKAF